MDSSNGREVSVRLLKTDGKGSFEEVEWTLPELKHDQIRVRSILTGVCRSDIDMMNGSFGPLPDHMQGHEGVGQVIAVGDSVNWIKVGEYVSTRGEPAYADMYNCDPKTYVIVRHPDPKYILEPVACGINLIYQAHTDFMSLKSDNRVAILGSGFLAWVAYHSIKNLGFNFDIEVIGNSNRSLWESETELKTQLSGQYNSIIDLSSNTDYFNQDIFLPNCLIIMGAEKNDMVTTDFKYLLWNAGKMIFPSPRNNSFYYCMQMARNWIDSGKLKVDSFWTKEYNRDTDWRQAFEDGNNRPTNYSRGYIRWDYEKKL